MKQNIVTLQFICGASYMKQNLTPARRKLKKVVLDALLLEHSDG
jgi:hypothetical protein